MDDKPESENYLASLLNKTLRITTTDTRMFLGQFKCTDSGLNIILSQTYEYRLPPPPKPTSTSVPIVLDLTSRYVGLVVVPGEYITKIEVEEFESQIKGKGGKMVAEGLKREKVVMDAGTQSTGGPYCAGGICDREKGKGEIERYNWRD